MNVHIEARHMKNNIYMTPNFIKEINNKEFLLPSFSYYNCDNGDLSCLENSTGIKFDFFSFSKENGISDKNDTASFASDYSKKVIAEYQKTKMFGILSNSKIGNCIIFFPTRDYFIAYVPKSGIIHNNYWNERFIESNKVETNWYAGIYN